MEINRREFIKISAGFAAAAALPPILQGCAGITRRDVPRCDTAGIQALTPVERDILCHASMAPSGHNTQPWTILVLPGGRWIIGSAMDRWLPAVDPSNRELMLSIGAFMENLAVAAGYHGLNAQFRILAVAGSDRDIAEARFTVTAPGGYSLEHLRARRTVRHGYAARDLRAADVARCEAGEAGRIHFFSASGAGGRYLARGTVEANRTQAWRNDAQEELSQWIRWSDAEAREFMNGLTPESMEIGGFAGWFVRHFYSAESVLTESFRNRTVDAVRDQVGSCGGWFIITSPGQGVPGLLETGRRFQRLFLKVRDLGIALHPMTQMLEEDPWRTAVVAELGVPGTVQFILRTGYIDSYPDPVSLRMPLSRIILS